MQIRTQIGVNLVFHLVVFRVGLELVLGAIGKRPLLAWAAYALQIPVHALVAGSGVPSGLAGGITRLTLLLVGCHAAKCQGDLHNLNESREDLHLVVALLLARVGCEGVGDVHCEHGLVEGWSVVRIEDRQIWVVGYTLQFASLLLGDSVLGACEIEVALSAAYVSRMIWMLRRD